MSPAARLALETQLHAYAQDTTARYGVAIFKSLRQEAVEDFTIRIAEAWKVGSKKESDGVLLSLFLDEHKVRIDTGYGVEAKLTDAMCARIIREQMAPRLRAGDVPGAISAALASIDRAVTGRELGLAAGAPVQDVRPAAQPHGDDGSGWGGIIFLFIAVGVVFAIIFFMKGGRGGGGGGGVGEAALWLAGSTLFGSGGSSSFGGGDGGGSSWGGSSGGSFGGGGATGDW